MRDPHLLGKTANQLDKGVGRVGQALLTVISWKAFLAYVRSSMVTTPVTYDTYWTVFMKDEVSAMSIFHVIRDFATNRGLRSRAAMIFMIMSMIFVLAFPTLVSAMTGYTTNREAFITDSQQNLIPFASFIPVAYIIHDGWRINLTGDYFVPFINVSFAPYGKITSLLIIV